MTRTSRSGSRTSRRIAPSSRATATGSSGTAGIFSFELTIPGGVLPAAGVTAVGVQPTHRRRGILRRMMRAQLDAIHDRGEPLAILWASEGQIYQRFGYGLATMAARIEVARDRSAFRAPHTPAGTIRLIDVDEAKRLLPPIHDAVRPRRPGFFNRTPAFWDGEVFYDPEHWRHGASAAWYAVHEVAGEPDGYARYRIRDKWDDAGPNSTIVVTDLVAENPAAHLDVWRFLLDIDLIARIEAWNVAPDDPIVLAVAEPRRLGIGLGDGMWLRVVDVALRAGRAPVSVRRLRRARRSRTSSARGTMVAGRFAWRAACPSWSRRRTRPTWRATRRTWRRRISARSPSRSWRTRRA